MKASHPKKKSLITSRIWLLVHNKHVILIFELLYYFTLLVSIVFYDMFYIFFYIWSAGMGIERLSLYEIKNKYLEMEYKEMEVYVNQQREKWKTYGCTIMSD